MHVAKRKAVGILITELGFSEHRACRIGFLARSVQLYRAMPKNDEAVIKRNKGTSFGEPPLWVSAAARHAVPRGPSREPQAHVPALH